MLGFSIYLDHAMTAEDYNYLIAMRNTGFNQVFVSLLSLKGVAEEIKSRLMELTKWCENLNLKVELFASPEILTEIGASLDNVGQIQALHINCLRLSGEVAIDVLARLSKSLEVAINANQIDREMVNQLREYNAAFDHLIAGYAYYPQVETGIDEAWFKKRNKWLKHQGFKVEAFIASNNSTRQDVTLECLRQQNPLSSMLYLKKYCERIIVSSHLDSSEILVFNNYLQKSAISLHLDSEADWLYDRPWINADYLARDIVMLGEVSDKQFDQDNGLARPAGSVCVTNSSYEGFSNYLQISKRDLPADPRITLLGQIKAEDLSLLRLIDPKKPVFFVK